VRFEVISEIAEVQSIATGREKSVIFVVFNDCTAKGGGAR